MDVMTAEAITTEVPAPTTMNAGEIKADLILYQMEEARFTKEWPDLTRAVRFRGGKKNEAEHYYSGF